MIRKYTIVFFFWKTSPKIKSRFEVFFVFRTKQSFWGVFCLQDKTVVLRYFLLWEQCSHFGGFFWKIWDLFGDCPQKIKISSKKKLRPFFFFFRVWSTKIFNQNDLYPQTKIKRRFGVFLESRKSKGHFGVFLEKLKQSFWGIFGEIEEVDLGYFLLKIEN